MSASWRLRAMATVKRVAAAWTRLGLKRYPPLKRIYRRLMLAASPEALTFVVAGRRFRFSTNEPGCGIDMARGRYEPLVTRHLSRALKPGMTFVDVGAHVGYFTLIGAHLVGPRGRVIAIEPDPDTSRRLRENLALNGIANAMVHEVAVGTGVGRAKLFRDPNGPAYNSLYDLPAVRAEPTEVPMLTLDEILADARPDVLKLDIEGAELDALRSGKRFLEEQRALVCFVEINEERLRAAGVGPHQVADRLMADGFALWLLDDYAGRVVPIRDPASDELSGLRWANLMAVRGLSPEACEDLLDVPPPSQR